MQGCFVQFMAYAMAMVGFLSICLLTYKKLCIQSQTGKNSDCLSIENALRLNPKKQIYIVRAGNERFLVASDSETTTMLAKLEDANEIKNNINNCENKTTSINSYKQISFNKTMMNKTPLIKKFKEKIKA